MNSFCRVGGIAIPFWLWAAGVSAQVKLEPGTRVRIFDGQRRIVGRIDAANDDAIALHEKPDSDPMVLSHSQIVMLEVSRRPSHRKKGALIGGALGVVAGIALAAVTDSTPCPPPQEDYLGIGCWYLGEVTSGPENYGLGAALLGTAGAGIGALVAGGEKWEAVTEKRLHVAVGPTRGGGVRFAASLRF